MLNNLYYLINYLIILFRRRSIIYRAQKNLDKSEELSNDAYSPGMQLQLNYIIVCIDSIYYFYILSIIQSCARLVWVQGVF